MTPGRERADRARSLYDTALGPRKWDAHARIAVRDGLGILARTGERGYLERVVRRWFKEPSQQVVLDWCDRIMRSVDDSHQQEKEQGDD